MTQITATALCVGENVIANGSVSLIICGSAGTPVPFRSGATTYEPQPFVGAIVGGVIQGTLVVPDLATVVPLQPHQTVSYRITVIDRIRLQSFTLTGVTEVTGPTWSFDNYTPASAAPVPVSAFSSGTGAPLPHASVDPAIYLRLDTQQLYASFGGSWLLMAPSQAGQASSDLPGTFVEAVSELMAVCALPGGFGVALSGDGTRPALGIAPAGVLAAGTGTIRTSGTVTNVSWSLMPGLPVFVGPTGTLTQSAPTLGYTQIVGYPVSPTTMLVQIEEPVFLG